MNSRFSVRQLGRPATACGLAHAIRGEFFCAVFLYSIGDRTDEVLETLAYGKIVYDAIGRQLPSPPEIDGASWNAVLNKIVNRFGDTALRAAASAA